MPLVSYCTTRFPSRRATACAAYDILNDPAKRKLYDSVDDVDDAVPPPTKETAEFYRVFGPVFARNAK